MRLLLIITVFIKLILIGFSHSYAQEIRYGIKGGISFYDLNVQAAGDAEYDFGVRTGFAGGIFAEIPLRSNLSVQPEIFFIQKGGSTSGFDLEVNYAEVPVYLKYYPSPSAVVSPYISAGSYISLLMGATQDLDGDRGEMSRVFSGVHVGFVAGLGLSWSDFDLSIRYEPEILNSLTNLHVFGEFFGDQGLDTGSSAKHSGFLISVGFRL